MFIFKQKTTHFSFNRTDRIAQLKRDKIMGLLLVLVIFHYFLTHVLYGYVEPYFYKQISNEDKCRTHFSEKIHLRRNADVNFLCLITMYIPILHFYGWWQYNRWLSNQLFKNNNYVLRMTFLGPIYYPLIAIKITLGR